MKVYVFGNQDVPQDNRVFQIVNELSDSLPEVEFIFIKPNQDLPFDGEKDIVILDAVDGIIETELFDESMIDKLTLSPRTSAHDFDLGFQLKYLKKIGKLSNVKILGIPITGHLNYSLIHSTFKKLVAQDMQGS